MKSLRIILCICMLTCWIPMRAHASVIINEIMFDLSGTDTDREWIELYNDSSSEVSLEGYKFNDGANHGLNTPPVNGGVGSLSIPPNGFAVLAANASVFKSEHSSYSGILIDTVMSLTNDGDSISLVDGNNDVVDSVTYTSSQGGAGDGNSLGSFGSALFPGTPTPGSENTKSSSSSTTEEEVTLTKEVETKEESIPRFAGTIMIGDPITSGVPVQFSTLIVNPERKVVLPGRYVWNFGDGTLFESYNGIPFFHTYSDPGEYVVYFEYYKSKGSYTPDVVIKKIVNVSEASVVISSVGTLTDPKIEISNTTGSDIDMSSWKISSGASSYILPKNSIVLKGKKIIIRPSVLGFVPSSQVALVHPSGAIASTMGFAPLKTPVATFAKIGTSESIQQNVVLGESVEKAHTGPVDPIETSAPENVLQAAVVESIIEGNTTTFSFKNTIYYGLFVAVLITGVIVVRKIRKKGTNNEDGNKSEYDADEFTFVE